MAERLVTVARYHNTIDAQLAQGALEAAGLHAMIVGDTNVAVDEAEAGAAEQIVNAMIGIAHAEHVGPSDEEPAALPERCEQCGSPEIARRQKLLPFVLFTALTFGVGAAVDNTLAAFYVFLAGIVAFLTAGGWRCRHCGFTW